jgi:hypothetical protein
VGELNVVASDKAIFSIFASGPFQDPFAQFAGTV